MRADGAKSGVGRSHCDVACKDGNGNSAFEGWTPTLNRSRDQQARKRKPRKRTDLSPVQGRHVTPPLTLTCVPGSQAMQAVAAPLEANLPARDQHSEQRIGTVPTPRKGSQMHKASEELARYGMSDTQRTLMERSAQVPCVC